MSSLSSSGNKSNNNNDKNKKSSRIRRSSNLRLRGAGGGSSRGGSTNASTGGSGSSSSDNKDERQKERSQQKQTEPRLPPTASSGSSLQKQQQQQQPRSPQSSQSSQPQPQGRIVSSSAQAVAGVISNESPLPPIVQRSLGDRSNEKRKNAALEIESLVKSLCQQGGLQEPPAPTSPTINKDDSSSNINNDGRKGEIQSAEKASNEDSNDATADPTIPNTNKNKNEVNNTNSPNNGVDNNNNLISNISSNNMNKQMILSIISVLSKDFCTSMNSNYRKGGLIGLAATSIGLLHQSQYYLYVLLPPVLHCFDDPESRVRYYACESLYNIAKVSRSHILPYFNQIFEGLTKLFADVDIDVKNGANLLDRLIKDIVTENESFHVETFLPLLQNYIRRTNPYIRHLLVGWITVLDSIPDISMIDYLPDFLDGLFNMLSDTNREIRQAADSALSEFLREVSLSKVVEFGPIVSILVLQCHSKERLNRLTSITWLAELIHHPFSGGDSLLPYHSDILGSIMRCISDGEVEIRLVAERTNNDLLSLVKETAGDFKLRPLLDTLISELLHKDDVPTKMASLRWINMLLEKRKVDMNNHVRDLLPVLLRTLSDPSDAVVLLNLQVLSRISLNNNNNTTIKKKSKQEQKSGIFENGGPHYRHGEDHNDESDTTDELQFQMVLNAILKLFASDRQLLETRGSLIIRKLCVLLNAKNVYIRMAEALSSYEESIGSTSSTDKTTKDKKSTSNSYFNNSNTDADNIEPTTSTTDLATLEFVSTMVQTLNLILLTAQELHDLRSILAKSFRKSTPSSNGNCNYNEKETNEGYKVFVSLYWCWCHNPISTFSLCLLAQAYDLSFELIKKFSQIDVTVGFLMQIDKLVHLLESPIFIHMRLQLLDVESTYHVPLLKSCYGLLMLLPQSDSFRLLNERLTTVCNLRENLGLTTLPPSSTNNYNKNNTNTDSSFTEQGPNIERLLERFDAVVMQHRMAKERSQRIAIQKEQQQAQTSSSSSSAMVEYNGNNNNNSNQPGSSSSSTLSHYNHHGSGGGGAGGSSSVGGGHIGSAGVMNNSGKGGAHSGTVGNAAAGTDGMRVGSKSTAGNSKTPIASKTASITTSGGHNNNNMIKGGVNIGRGGHQKATYKNSSSYRGAGSSVTSPTRDIR